MRIVRTAGMLVEAIEWLERLYALGDDRAGVLLDEVKPRRGYDGKKYRVVRAMKYDQ
jgi:hypothetical protein